MEQIIETVARKWGDSIAVIIPKKIVDTQNIKPLDKISISLSKGRSIKEAFGAVKSWKINSQKTKEEIRREEWKD